jgi:tRNA(Ile2) C34 agmatinyltransferase TiaS
MPHLICPSCGLTSYSAAGRVTLVRCSRCDAALTGDSADDRVGRWNLAAVRPAARRKEAQHGTR